MNTVYLDNAATAYPKSDCVFAAMKAAFYSCGNGGRGGHSLAINASETVYNCREQIANLFGSVSENVVLCSGATLALNMAIKGIADEKSTVLCSTFEHNSVLRPLYALSMAGRIKLEFFTPSLKDDKETIEAFKSALQRGVRLAVLTHASNVCGLCLPVKKLCAIAKSHNVKTVIDCAQTAGHTNIDIKDIGADIICIAGHKGLGGPMGTGALIVNPEKAIQLSTIIEGGTGVASREKTMPHMLPERLEAGTANITGISGLGAACKELVINNDKENKQRVRLINGLQSIRGIKLYGCFIEGEYMPLVLFNVGNFPSEMVAEQLAERGICVRGGLHCSPLAHCVLGSGRYGGVRASIGKGNTESDIDALLNACEDISKILLAKEMKR